MNIGEIYAYRDDGLYSKVKITEVREFEEMNLQNDEYEVKTFITFEYIGSYRRGQSDTQKIESFIFNIKSLDRDANCWKCKRNLSDQKDEICPKCGWIVCPSDKACGCDYGKIYL